MCASSKYIKEMQEKQAQEIITRNQNLSHKEIILLIEEESSIRLEYAIELFDKFKHLIPNFYLATTIEDKFFEAEQRLHWFINGKNIHCLSVSLFTNLTTQRLCEIYNVEPSYFKKCQ